MTPTPKRRGNNARGRSDFGPPFIQLFHWIYDTPEFREIPGSALRLLLDFAREYRGPGSNNGDLSFETIRRRDPTKWRSASVRVAAAKYLVDNGWLIKTRHGGLHAGPDLFAVSWWPIDECKGKHDYPAESKPSNAWRKKMAVLKPELLVPESGTEGGSNITKKGSAVPETGTVKPFFPAA